MKVHGKVIKLMKLVDNIENVWKLLKVIQMNEHEWKSNENL